MKKQKHTNNCMSRQNLDTTVYISTVEVKIYVDNELDSIEQDRRVLYTDYNTLVSELRRLEDLYPAPSYRFDILIEVGDTFEFPRLTRHGARAFAGYVVLDGVHGWDGLQDC